MATVALAPLFEFPLKRSPYEHYRIANAEYGLVGWEQEIGPSARLLASRLAADGVRLGVLTLNRDDRGSEANVYSLLAPLSRITVVGSALCDWIRPLLTDPCGPRLFRVTATVPLTEDHLADAVDSMLTCRAEKIHYGPVP